VTSNVSIFEFGPFVLREATCELLRDHTLLRVERRAYDLLVYLIRHRERVVPSSELLSRLWDGASVTRSSLARAVALLRQLLDDAARTPAWIATVHGRGYRFVGKVRETAAGPTLVLDQAAALQLTWSVPPAADPLVGRENELAHLSEGLDSARHAGGRVYLLSGEPGIGKTRLAQELARRAAQLGWEVLTAWCHPGEGAPSYWPWIQLIRGHARGRDARELHSDLGPSAQVIAYSIPELSHVLEGPAAALAPSEKDARFYLFDAVTRLFVTAARRKPLLLLLDDLHGADGPSLRLLAFLCREVANAPLLVLGTHRSADIDVSDRCGRPWATSRAADFPSLRLELEAFDRLADEVRQPQALWNRVMFRACISQLEGRYADMRQLRDRFLEIGESVGDVNARHAAATFDVFLAWEEGRFEDALAITDGGSRVFDAWKQARMHMLAECGRRDEAHRLLLETCADHIGLRNDLLWICHIISAAETCDLIQDRIVARVLYEALLPYRDRIMVMGYGWGVWGSPERNLGALASTLGDWERAIEHFNAALCIHERIGARAMVVRTKYRYAMMLLARSQGDDRARARRLMDEASVEARSLGLKNLLDRLAKLPA
jgi:DNA-binding winged helix-turn-helix (wHTH) protein